MDDLKAIVERDEQGKRARGLWEAFKVAAEGHDLAYFKKILLQHEQALHDDREEQAEHEAKKQAKKDKRKSKDAAADEEDISMEEADGDAGAAKAKAKPSKKRKKAADSDAEDEKVSSDARGFCLLHTDVLLAGEDSKDQVEGQWAKDSERGVGCQAEEGVQIQEGCQSQGRERG